MPLSSILSKVITMTGRVEFEEESRQPELISIINTVQRYFDSKIWNYRKSMGTKVVDLREGMFFVTVQNLATLKTVSVANSSGLSELDFKTYDAEGIRKLYTADPNLVISRSGTITIDEDAVTGDADTTFLADGVLDGMFLYTPSLEGGAWFLVDGDAATESSLAITSLDGSAYAGVHATPLKFYIMTVNISRGTPVYAAINSIRLVDTDSDTLPAIDTMDLLGDLVGGLDSEGLILYPPPDQAYTLRITGEFFSGTLSSLTDVSFWTEIHPDVLAVGVMWFLNIPLENRAAQLANSDALNEMIEPIRREAIALKVSTQGNRMRRQGIPI